MHGQPQVDLPLETFFVAFNHLSSAMKFGKVYTGSVYDFVTYFIKHWNVYIIETFQARSISSIMFCTTANLTQFLNV